MKSDFEHMKRLEEDCVSIQKSLATIQSAQRVLSLYTADERNKLFREYDALKRDLRDSSNMQRSVEALEIFRQDHFDLAVIGEVMDQLDSVDLNKLQLGI